MLRAVRAKARIRQGQHPSLKAGVNERQFVDDAIVLVFRYFGTAVGHPFRVLRNPV